MSAPPETTTTPEISFVLPIYREAQRLPETLRNLMSFTQKWKFPIEIIVSQDPSDESQTEKSLLESTLLGKPNLQLQLLSHPKRLGRGPAVALALAKARGHYVFVLAADLAVPLAEILNTLQDFREQPQVDLIVGHRYHEKKLRHGERNSWVMTLEAAVRERHQRTGSALKDPTCPFIAFRRRGLEKWQTPHRLGRWFYTPAIVKAAEQAQLMIFEKAILSHDTLETRFGWREALAHLF